MTPITSEQEVAILDKTTYSPIGYVSWILCTEIPNSDVNALVQAGNSSVQNTIEDGSNEISSIQQTSEMNQWI